MKSVISLALLTVFAGVAQAACKWEGKAPFCGYYCSNAENQQKYPKPGKKVVATYSSVEACISAEGNYSNKCDNFGEGCTSWCKALYCDE